MDQISGGTLQSRGYHMTEQDVETIRAQATVAVVARQKTLHIAQSRLSDLRQEMGAVLADVRTKNEYQLVQTEFNRFDWWNSDVIKQTAQDVVTAQEELAKAIEHARKLGAAIPD
jgi:hypothetical protein